MSIGNLTYSVPGPGTAAAKQVAAACLDCGHHAPYSPNLMSCEACGTRCPNEIRLAPVMDALKHMALEETRRRRKIQEEFNRTHNITPTSIKKSIRNILASIYEADYYTIPLVAEAREEYISPREISKVVRKLRKEMREAAQELDFERAALLRDRIRHIQEADLMGDMVK